MKTKTRSVRVADDLWAAFLSAASARGETGTDALTRYMRKYAARTPSQSATPSASAELSHPTPSVT